MPGRPAGSADDPILASKITAPSVPDWVVWRRRITKLIAQGTRRCPLTAVTGPPGAGKTMAVALWVAAEPGPVAWVCLDGYDNRPGVFWSYVVAALRRSGVAVPQALSATTRGRTAEHLFLLRLASLLAAQDPPVMLVVDDFHLLTEPRVLNGLDFLLRNAGLGLRLVICSRADPLLPLHRYRLAGELTEVREGDLAFSRAEARQLLARHGHMLSAGSLERLTRQTEGWAAGLRLAALSMAAHPDCEQSVRELVTEESTLTGYLVQEVLDTQSLEAREVLLSTSILEHVNAEIASELAGIGRVGRILVGLAHANAFVQPTGGGWYRYHTLFAEVLRLKLRLERPDRIASLHQQAARWYERSGQLADAVRHAAAAGDWQLAASIVIDGLAISEIVEPAGSPSLADEFASMPDGAAWTEPQPYLVSAAVALSAGRPQSAVTALDVSEQLIGRLPAGQEDAARLAAAMIRLAVCRRTGDLAAAAEAAGWAEARVSRIPGDLLVRHPEIRARVLSARGAVELWSGNFDEAARVLDSGEAAAATSGAQHERADCLGHLALAEALRGRLSRAAKLAAEAAAVPAGAGQRPAPWCPNPAALIALAWVHLERGKLAETRSQLTQAHAALGGSPDRPISALACLAAARGHLVEGHIEAAMRFVGQARARRPVPGWLDRTLSLVESRTHVAAGDIEAALAAAKRADCDSSPEAAVSLARAWVAAGDDTNARRALAPALAALNGAPEHVLLQALLVDAQLSYNTGDHRRGRRSLASALRLATPEQLRLPFVMERGWIGLKLRRDPELAHACHRLLAPVLRHDELPTPPEMPDQAAILMVEPLTRREQEVLRHLPSWLSTAEIASEMHVSIHTVKTHLKHIYRKLAAAHRREAVRRARQLELI